MNIKKEFGRVASLLLDALFPRRCPVCGDIVMPRGNLICPACQGKLSFVKPPVCKKCGKEIESEAAEYCYDCGRHRRTYEYGAALINYNEISGRSMAAVKYKNRREYLDYYAREAAKRLGGVLEEMAADCLIPVPVHPARYRLRGYNQALVLADKLGKEMGIPVCPGILKRNKNTEPQKELGSKGRLKNLEKAFTVGRIPEGMDRVILVDDIYTTGSTIEACTRALKAAGIKKVYYFAVCIGQGQ